MTGPLTITVRASTYTVEVEPSLVEGKPLFLLSDQLGGTAGHLDTGAISGTDRIIGAPAWWSEQDNQAAVHAIRHAYDRQARQQSVPPMQRRTANGPVRFNLTVAGHNALALDQELQARMDTAALDEIAALLRASDEADPTRVLALVGEQVAATRRTIKAAARTG